MGNVNSLRDWGDAEDYVKVIYKTLKINKAYNFIICTGIKRSIKDFINILKKTQDSLKELESLVPVFPLEEATTIDHVSN